LARPNQRGSFLYPSAGDDLDEVLAVFAPHVYKFSFCDLHDGKGLKLRPAFQSGSGYKLISRLGENREGRSGVSQDHLIALGLDYGTLSITN
jgi:hypothetical protein